MRDALAGRAALIAGASQGLGREIALAFARAGASVAICARDASALEETRAAVAEVAGPDRVVAKTCDVSKPDEVDAYVRAAIVAFPHLDILVNSAGIYGPMGAIEDTDWAAWVRAIEIDLFGAVLLCRAVIPHLKQRGAGKIVQLSGGGATSPMPRLTAYAAAKAAVVRFAESLALELAPHAIDVNCIAPGALNTRMLDEVLSAGPDAVGADFYARAVKQKEQGGAGLERGTSLAIFLASSASDGITGRLISAVWDPWEDLPARREELAKSDIYALRRIVPGDRGRTWGDRK